MNRQLGISITKNAFRWWSRGDVVRSGQVGRGTGPSWWLTVSLTRYRNKWTLAWYYCA